MFLAVYCACPYLFETSTYFSPTVKFHTLLRAVIACTCRSSGATSDATASLQGTHVTFTERQQTGGDRIGGDMTAFGEAVSFIVCLLR
jgi:hypothetical protein